MGYTGRLPVHTGFVGSARSPRIEEPAVKAELLRAVKSIRHYRVCAVDLPADLADGSPKVAGPQRDDLGLTAIELAPQFTEILLQLLIFRNSRMMLRKSCAGHAFT